MSDKPTVILVHGLFLRSPIMWLLGYRLCKRNYIVKYYNYFSTRRSYAESVNGLLRQMNSLKLEEVALVGHSLGGLVALGAAKEFPGNVKLVALGSPFNGSIVARWLSKYLIGRLLLGRAIEVLSSGIKYSKSEKIQFGIIAGNIPIGLGRISPDLKLVNDGTVQLSETVVQDIPHICLPVTHTSMVYSQAVADETLSFLDSGKFSI